MVAPVAAAAVVVAVERGRARSVSAHEGSRLDIPIVL